MRYPGANYFVFFIHSTFIILIKKVDRINIGITINKMYNDINMVNV